MTQVDVSVIIPAYNEEKRLGQTLEKVVAYFRSRSFTFEVLVVDDGSGDGTVALVQALGASVPQVKVLQNDKNRGKGYSVSHGMREAKGRYRLFSDADLSTPIEEIEKLMGPLDQGYDLAIGSRDIVGSDIQVPQPLYRRIMGYTFMVMRDWIAISGFRDTQCGFKMLTDKAAEVIFPRVTMAGFSFDVEILAIGRAHGLRMCEIPVVWRDDRRSRVNPLRDPILMLIDLVRIRLNLLRGVYGKPVPPSGPGAEKSVH